MPISETRKGIKALGFARLDEVIYPGARHEVFNETNKDEVLPGLLTSSTRSPVE